MGRSEAIGWESRRSVRTGESRRSGLNDDRVYEVNGGEATLTRSRRYRCCSPPFASPRFGNPRHCNTSAGAFAAGSPRPPTALSPRAVLASSAAQSADSMISSSVPSTARDRLPRCRSFHVPRAITVEFHGRIRGGGKGSMQRAARVSRGQSPEGMVFQSAR